MSILICFWETSSYWLPLYNLTLLILCISENNSHNNCLFILYCLIIFHLKLFFISYVTSQFSKVMFVSVILAAYWGDYEKDKKTRWRKGKWILYRLLTLSDDNDLQTVANNTSCHLMDRKRRRRWKSHPPFLCPSPSHRLPWKLEVLTHDMTRITIQIYIGHVSTLKLPFHSVKASVLVIHSNMHTH